MKKADLSQRVVITPRTVTPPKVDAHVDTPPSITSNTHTDPVATERSGDVKKVAGDIESAGGAGGQGAAQIVANLQIVDDGAKKKKKGIGAAVSGMLLALALTFGYADPSHAQSSTQQWVTHPSLVVLPHNTGPPIAFTSGSGASNSALNLRLDQTTTPSTRTPEMQARIDQAFANFDSAMIHALGFDAEGAALRAATGRDINAPLTDEQQKLASRALSNLLRELPVGALSPRLAEVLKDGMRARGMSVAGVENKTVRELGDAGKDLVKGMIDELRHERPAVFYGTAVGLAGVIGYVGYTQGTDALANIGIKPEIKTSFFDDALTAKLRMEWGAKFVDPKVHAELERKHTYTIGGATLHTRASIGVVASGTTFGNLEAQGFTLSHGVSGTLGSGGWLELGSQTTLTGGKVEHVTVAGTYTNDPWRASLAAQYFAQDERVVGQLSVGYKPSKNVDWSFVGTHDSKGKSGVGVGLKVTF